MTIRVLRRHIKKGEPDNIHKCPIALAAKEQGLCKVKVYIPWMEWNTGRTRHFGDLPHMAKTFARRFDAGKPVKPFSFKLEPPDA